MRTNSRGYVTRQMRVANPFDEPREFRGLREFRGRLSIDGPGFDRQRLVEACIGHLMKGVGAHVIARRLLDTYDMEMEAARAFVEEARELMRKAKDNATTD